MKRLPLFRVRQAIGLSLWAWLGLSVQAHAVTSPTFLSVKVFEMRVSSSSSCQNGITVFRTAAPTAVDLVGNPTLAVASVPDFIYHCVMFHIDDIIDIVPQTPGGSCTAGTNHVDIYSNTALDFSQTPEGFPIQAHAGLEDDPWIYFSDSPAASPLNNCFAPNTNGCLCSGPCSLSAFRLSSDQTRTLVIDFDNKIDTSGGTCAIQQPISGDMLFR